MYLLDTNVISELFKPRPNAAVLEWLAGVPEGSMHLSAVTIGELQAGAEAVRERNPARAGEIEAWVDRVVDAYNVLAMDALAFRRWAKLLHGQPDHLYENAMIAAVADTNGLTVATRNVRDFERLGVRTFNPFERNGT